MTEKLSAEVLAENYAEVRQRLESALRRAGRSPDDVTLLAATKTVEPEVINSAIALGITHIGENRVQELLSKEDALLPVHRHFIGHLQTNKVKSVVGRVEMIESVHSLKLAREISSQSEKCGLCTDILLEVNIGGEEAKFGFAPNEVLSAAEKVAEMPNLRLKGLMAIPPFDPERENTRKYFRKMYKLFIDIGAEKLDNVSMNVLSMGMSGDFDIAAEEGATLVRVGSALFGKRIYK